MPARYEANAPRTTEKLRSGEAVGTPGDVSSGPSAQHANLTYKQRHARARRGPVMATTHQQQPA
jgi:hypothetical protein